MLCGNFAERPEGQGQADLYASGASAESLTLLLRPAFGWELEQTSKEPFYLLHGLRRYAIIPLEL